MDVRFQVSGHCGELVEGVVDGRFSLMANGEDEVIAIDENGHQQVYHVARIVLKSVPILERVAESCFVVDRHNPYAIPARRIRYFAAAVSQVIVYDVGRQIFVVVQRA